MLIRYVPVMVPKSNASRSPFLTNNASILTLGVMAVVLSGCDEQKLASLLGTLAIALVLIIVVQFIVWAGLFTIFVVNLVHLGRGKPNLYWGMASLCTGAFSLFVDVRGLVGALSFQNAAELAFSCGLCWVGYKNVKGARERALWERMGERDDADSD